MSFWSLSSIDLHTHGIFITDKIEIEIKWYTTFQIISLEWEIHKGSVFLEIFFHIFSVLYCADAFMFVGRRENDNIPKSRGGNCSFFSILKHTIYSIQIKWFSFTGINGNDFVILGLQFHVFSCDSYSFYSNY